MKNKIKKGLIITILLMGVIMMFTSCDSETNYPETTNTEVSDSTCVDTIITPVIVPLDSNRLVVVVLEDSIQ